MNIAILGYNGQLGGITTAYQQLIYQLNGLGHRITAVSLSDTPCRVPASVAAHYTIPFSNGLYVKKAIGAFRAAVGARLSSPKVFISIGVSPIANAITQILPSETFTICQDVQYDRIIDDPLLKSTALSFDALAPQSVSMERRLRGSASYLTHVKWLPCFPHEPTPGIQAQLSSTPPFSLAYFGRLVPHKGLDLLLAAMREIPATKLTLDIWGAGDPTPYEKTINELGIAEKIRLRGRYPQGEECGLLMCTYDGVALPTISNEGLPLILLEGMSYGLPLLTTTVGAIPDCCSENPDAVMVPPTLDGLRSGLAEFIQRLERGCFNPSRHKRFYDRHYSTQAMLRRWTECLDSPREFFRGLR